MKNTTDGIKALGLRPFPIELWQFNSLFWRSKAIGAEHSDDFGDVSSPHKLTSIIFSSSNSVKKRKWGDEKDTSRVSSSSPSSSTTSGPAPPSSAAEAAAKAAAMVTALLAAKGISIDNKPMDFSKIEPPPPPVLRPAPLAAPPHVQKRAFNPEDPEEGIVKKGEKFLKKVDINDIEIAISWSVQIRKSSSRRIAVLK